VVLTAVLTAAVMALVGCGAKSLDDYVTTNPGATANAQRATIANRPSGGSQAAGQTGAPASAGAPSSPKPTESTKTSSAPSTYPTAATELVPYRGVVENLFFHPVVAYPELAFDGNPNTSGIDAYMVTASEYEKMLQSMYDKHYILVDWNDVWSERVDANGVRRMKRNTLLLPAGKKPIIINFDDVNYYQYMLGTGFTYKLIIGPDGNIWSWGRDPKGRVVISQDLDAITILDKFVAAHPDFSMNGAKGCINLTGYEGVLGYRTQTDDADRSAAFEANRRKQIAAVRPVIARLKATGWYFASHTWGHIDLSTSSMASIEADSARWQREVGSLVGPTKILVYPFGARPDGGDVTSTGPVFRYLQSKGFRIFASVGDSSFSQVKPDISAVVEDRMHADGTTLRNDRGTYLKFYDAKLVFDHRRPHLGTNW